MTPGMDRLGSDWQQCRSLTPINIPPDLSYHAYWDKVYEPVEQWRFNVPPAPTGDIPD